MAYFFITLNKGWHPNLTPMLRFVVCVVCVCVVQMASDWFIPPVGKLTPCFSVFVLNQDCVLFALTTRNDTRLALTIKTYGIECHGMIGLPAVLVPGDAKFNCKTWPITKRHYTFIGPVECFRYLWYYRLILSKNIAPSRDSILFYPILVLWRCIYNRSIRIAPCSSTFVDTRTAAHSFSKKMKFQAVPLRIQFGDVRWWWQQRRVDLSNVFFFFSILFSVGAFHRMGVDTLRCWINFNAITKKSPLSSRISLSLFFAIQPFL